MEGPFSSGREKTYRQVYCSVHTCTCERYVDMYCSSSLTSSVSSLISDVEEEEDNSYKHHEPPMEDYISGVPIPSIG